jgi:hypothetical protein
MTIARTTGAALAAFALVPALPGGASAQTAQLAAEGTTVAVLFMLGTITMKIAAIVIGYLIVRLGHDTLVRGITGDLDFGFKGSGVETKLKSASPGAAFVLAGAAIIVWALAVQKPFSLDIGPAPGGAASHATDRAAAPPVPKIRD